VIDNKRLDVGDNLNHDAHPRIFKGISTFAR